MKTRILAAALTIGFVVLPAMSEAQQAAPEQDITGVYVSEGANPDGEVYRSPALVERMGQAFLVTWKVQMDEKTVDVHGVGILSGGMLAVSYISAQNGQRAPAIVLYKVEGTRLTGRWTVGGAGVIFRETMTKVAELPAEPSTPTPTQPPAQQLPVLTL